MGDAAGTASRTAAGLALAAAVVLVAQLWSAPSAGAHAVLLDTAPEEDEVVDGAPTEVELIFNEPMQPPATVSVTGPDGDDEDVTDGDATIDGEVVRVDLATLTDGTYVVAWRAVSADDHPVEGEFAFEVSGAAGEEATEEPDPDDDLAATEDPAPEDDLEATEEPEGVGEPEGEATEDPAEEELGEVDATEPAVAEGDGDGIGVLPLLLAAAVLIAVLATGAAALRQRRGGSGGAHAADVADRN